MYAYYSKIGQVCFLTRIGPVNCHSHADAITAAYRAGMRAIWLDDPDDWRMAVETARQEGYFLVTDRRDDAPANDTTIYAIGARTSQAARELTIFGPPALAAWGFPRAATWIDLSRALETLNAYFGVRLGDGTYTPGGLAVALVKRYVRGEHLVPHPSELEIASEWRAATRDLSYIAADRIAAGDRVYLVDRRSAYLTVASDTVFGIGELARPAAPAARGHYLAEVEISGGEGSLLGLRSGPMVGEYVRIAIAAGYDVTVSDTRAFAATAGVFRTWAGHLWEAREAFRGTMAEAAVKSLALRGLGWACRNRPALWARIVGENARRMHADARTILASANAAGHAVRWVGAQTDALAFSAPASLSADQVVGPLLAKAGRGGYRIAAQIPGDLARAAVEGLPPARAFVALARMDAVPQEIEDAAV